METGKEEAVPLLGEKEQQEVLINFMLESRKGRRALGATLGSRVSEEPCEVCKGPVGVVTAGQTKRYCGKPCRLRRHNGSV